VAVTIMTKMDVIIRVKKRAMPLLRFFTLSFSLKVRLLTS